MRFHTYSFRKQINTHWSGDIWLSNWNFCADFVPKTPRMGVSYGQHQNTRRDILSCWYFNCTINKKRAWKYHWYMCPDPGAVPHRPIVHAPVSHHCFYNFYYFLLLKKYFMAISLVWTWFCKCGIIPHRKSNWYHNDPNTQIIPLFKWSFYVSESKGLLDIHANINHKHSSS